MFQSCVKSCNEEINEDGGGGGGGCNDGTRLDPNCYNSLQQQQPLNGCARVPNTPEILNALISINPMDTFMSQQNAASVDDADNCSNASSSNLGSPASPPNQLNMRTQLIKEDLKMRLQERRMLRNHADDQSQQQQQQQQQQQHAHHQSAHKSSSRNQFAETRYSSSGCDESSMDTEEDDGNSSNCDTNSATNELTPEDEERRKRRRERNKLAAMKCRLKKRERTDRLEHESVNLENQNQKMKSNIRELEGELQDLKTILQTHKPSCVNPSPEPTPVDDPQQPPSFLPNNGGVNVPSQQQQPQPQPSIRISNSALPFSPLDIPEFSLSTPTTEDFFTENLAHLPRHSFLFG